MRIEIATRLKPYSFLPHVFVQIPKSSYAAEIFPTRIRLYDVEGSEPRLVREEMIPWKGPLRIMVVQDLEKEVVTVYSDQGRYHILPNLHITFQKRVESTLSSDFERLSLGSHKKQEWESLKKHLDVNSIFPIWHRLGSLLNASYPRGEGGPFSLINEIRDSIESKQPENILPLFEKLFLAGFKDMMVPRLIDDEFQGILQEEGRGGSPLSLLQESASLIRSLFLTQEGEVLSILPNCPPDFFAGRLISSKVPPLGEVSFEWTKKMIRRLVFKSTYKGKIRFKFPSDIASFRLRKSKIEKGRIVSKEELVEINSGELYLLDRFQK